jgi:glycosyltransferase involved in cell wall biosynthesis
MKLLVVTQVVDTNDPRLGFFHRWIEELATRAEHVDVICLSKGTYSFPENVRVRSLGKETGKKPSYVYALRFFLMAWKIEKEYDTVFVHMNQEYVLIAGWLWELLGKRVYLWRNHYAGSFLTDIASWFCDKVFCTSKHSYTARFKKTVLMPVGVDTERFFPDERITRVPRSILFLARMTESKRPGMVVDALIVLAKKGVSFTANFIGPVSSEDEQYVAALKQRVIDAGCADYISFYPGVPNDKVPDIFRAHEIYVNAAASGMYDKTLFEAAACGCQVLAASDDWRAVTTECHWFDGTANNLAASLTHFFAVPSNFVLPTRVIYDSSLSVLGDRLIKELY